MNYNYPAFNPYYMQQNPMQFQQPVMQQQAQPYTPQVNQFAIPGKVVESYDVFKSVDVPFDGNTYYFPKADGKEVYSKRWLQNGTTEQLVYKIQAQEQEEPVNPNADILQKLDAMSEQITALQDAIGKQAKGSGSKKEG